MSLVRLTNNIGGQFVSTLKSGATLRLDNKQTLPVKDTEITPTIENLVKKGLILSENVPEVKKETTVSNKKTSK